MKTISIVKGSDAKLRHSGSQNLSQPLTEHISSGSVPFLLITKGDKGENLHQGSNLSAEQIKFFLFFSLVQNISDRVDWNLCDQLVLKSE